MVDWGEIKTPEEIVVLLNTFTGITTAEIRIQKQGEWFKPADNYLLSWAGIRLGKQIDQVGYDGAESPYMLYIKSTSTAQLIQRTSYISDGFVATQDGNNSYQIGNLEYIGKYGKVFYGYVPITQTVYNLRNGYT